MIRKHLELIVAVIMVALALMTSLAWVSSRHDQESLRATISQQKKVIDAADYRETQSKAKLNNTLAEIQHLKNSTQTTAQVIAQLPKYLPLPRPIMLMHTRPVIARANLTPPTSAGTSAIAHTRDEATNSGPDNSLNIPFAVLPSTDLKPLFDFVQDSRECQAELAVVRQNSSDNMTKLSAVLKERDAALTTAKGGSFMRRLRRNALWFASGVLAGYVLKR